MILFHVSNTIVKEPRVIESNRFLDFGPGFYTTTNKDQAINFAQKVVTRRKGVPTVNIYELDENNIKGFKIKRFDGPNEEWLNFVSANRNGEYQGEQYDVIIGPVADDDVYRTLDVYASGILTKEQALEALKIKKLFNQYVFTSDAVLEFLKFINAEEYQYGRKV